MVRLLPLVVACWLTVFSGGPLVAAETPDVSQWTIYITNDNCPDYTWGLTEEQTRQAFADIVKGHLDEMQRTDKEPAASQDRYNMAVTQEALCFVERYPERKEELIRRIQQGRVFVSPYLCNSLWGFQSGEGVIRTFYPARRLERDWGISIDCAQHIELPSLPWATPTLLAGCGIRWLTNPYLGYDSTFDGLKNPPLFLHEGPDGSRIAVSLDRWASGKSSYTQGAALLRKPDDAIQQWVPHYAGLGAEYPLRAILAAGTHGDISPSKGNEARGFAEAIIKYNARPEPHPKLVNATYRQFWQAVDAEKTGPLPVVRGCFGHSWDLWPLCTAKYAAGMREGERKLLAAETLLALAAPGRPELAEATRADRVRAEWCWAMLSDHAWNGTDDRNKRHNSDLRRKWSEELNRLAEEVVQHGWAAAGLKAEAPEVTVFNSLSTPRRGLVSIDAPQNVGSVADAGRQLPSQIVEEDTRRRLCFVSPEVPGFGFKQLQLKGRIANSPGQDSILPHVGQDSILSHATPALLESPYYRLVPDPKTGGISSLVHKATGTELVVPGKGRTLCQTVYFDGQEHTLTGVKVEPVAQGPVLARLRISGTAAGMAVSNDVTVYGELDQVDFDLRIQKPVSTKQERLCQVFPVMRPRATLRVSTAGAVIRPRRQPEGDLLPGADTRRFAVQEFVSAATDELSVTIAPWDAFALRLDLDPISFEALGNDQNYREVARDQNGETSFRYRYSLRASAKGYRGPEAVAFGRNAATPLLAAVGRVGDGPAANVRPAVTVDPARAVAICLKPADGDPARGCVLRLWEVAGRSGPVEIGLRGFRKAVATDLLERDGRELAISDGKINVELRPHGYGAVRLEP